MSGDPVLASLMRLVNGQARLEDRLTGLGDRLAGLEGRLAGLGDGLAGLENWVVKLEDGQTRLRVDLMERMDRFENRLVATQEDIGVNMGAVSTLYDRQAGTRREVDTTGSMLHGMMRQIHRLQNDVEALRKRSA